jgi:iron complex transport system ATP-binding protein
MATINNSLIEVEGLSFGYNRGEEILSGISCSVNPDKFTVMMGRNGSGKSTLLRLVSGILPYHKGSIRIRGTELKKLKPGQRARHIGFLAQQHKAVFPFRVSEVVLTGRASYIKYLPGREDEYEAARAMELTGISCMKDRIYSELSGGEQQLVMIARILAQNPDILLMDEPISHLDYNNQIHILKMIRQLVSNGVSVVAVLHDPNMALLFGDEFIYIHDNRAHEVQQKNAWEHAVVNRIFHDDLQPFEYKGKYLLIPQLP